MRVVGGVHNLVGTDLIAAFDPMALVPEGGPHVGAENFARLLGERGAFGHPALVKLMVELFE